MAVQTTPANTQVRIMVRIDVPKAESSVALALHGEVAELIKNIPGANVEVSLLPVFAPALTPR